jgi:hypothetical protein
VAERSALRLRAGCLGFLTEDVLEEEPQPRRRFATARRSPPRPRRDEPEQLGSSAGNSRPQSSERSIGRSTSSIAERRGGGGCAGCLSSLRRSSGSCLPGAISSRPGQDPRIRPAGRARKHRRADLLLPASQATGLPSCCLCTNMWITCAQRRRACAYAVEMLGIPLPGRNHDRGLNLGERESHPVHAQETEIIHMPRRNR